MDLPMDPDLDAPIFKEQIQTCFDTVKKVLETRTHDKPKSLVVRTWPGTQVSKYPLIDLLTYNSEYVYSSFDYSLIFNYGN